MNVFSALFFFSIQNHAVDSLQYKRPQLYSKKNLKYIQIAKAEKNPLVQGQHRLSSKTMPVGGKEYGVWWSFI